jgi:hypothetical protein
MSITLFGSCRISKISGANTIHLDTTYTHSTKEVIQLIKFLKGDLSIPEIYRLYCFRTAILSKSPLDYDELYKDSFDTSELFIIEICSAKTYIHNKYYLHHLSVDKRFASLNIKRSPDIFNNYSIQTQTDSEIEEDILEIQKLVFPRKIIIVSHYNSVLNGKVIPSRNHLIKLLKDICKKHSIFFVDPTEVLKGYSQERIMLKDLGHFTDFGRTAFSEYMDNYIRHLKIDKQI